MTAAEEVIASLTGLRRAYPDDDLMVQLLTAVLAPHEVITTIIRGTDDSPPWTVWRDPDFTPVEMLDWLAQQAGVRFDPADDEATRRDKLKDPAGFADGKTSTLVAAVKRTLTGAQAVRVLKRVDGSMWRTAVVTRTDETPDPAATLAAALEHENAGARITHVITDFALFADWTRAFSATTAHFDSLELGDVT